MAEDKITLDTEVSTTELASVLGITGRRIRQMAEDGQLEKTAQGRFLLCNSVHRYISFQSKERELSKEEKERIDAEVSIKKAKAIMSVLEAKELQGKMHRSEDVAALTSDLIYTIRGALIALPGRLAVEVIEAKTAAEAAEMIRSEVYRVMESIADYKYDSKKYEERVRNRNQWDSDDWDADEQP